MKSVLEIEVESLRAKLDDLAERVRLDAVAAKFLAGDHEICEADFARVDDHAVKIFSEGKWTYGDGIERLYTIAEVAEILAKASRDVTSITK